ncbi:MAG: Crp/Fnr family transcriptional regulator [Gammaproteobacteria bacterium]|nr:Crp/Fnr family transcriptional regulator [Gammaproteobacteria bacterium]
MSPAEKKLLTFFKRLVESDRQSLLAFAEFLCSREKAESAGPVPEPQPIPRPEGESVVAAIKRLSATYPMLDRPELLNESSVLMTQHVMQGREAGDVVDELEVLFRRFYDQQFSNRNGLDS